MRPRNTNDPPGERSCPQPYPYTTTTIDRHTHAHIYHSPKGKAIAKITNHNRRHSTPRQNPPAPQVKQPTQHSAQTHQRKHVAQSSPPVNLHHVQKYIENKSQTVPFPQRSDLTRRKQNPHRTTTVKTSVTRTINPTDSALKHPQKLPANCTPLVARPHAKHAPPKPTRVSRPLRHPPSITE